MIAVAALLGERPVTTRVLAPEFFDALEKSIDRYGLWLSPSLKVVPTDFGSVEIQPRALFGHVITFGLDVEEREPDLAQAWMTAAMNRLEALNLTPQLVGEAVVSFNIMHRRAFDHRLTWTETCVALGLAREDG